MYEYSSIRLWKYVWIFVHKNNGLISECKGERMRENDKMKKFLKIGNTRVKVGNIKDYGIGYETFFYEKVYTKKSYSKLTWDGETVRIDEIRYLELSSELRKTYKLVLDDNGVAKEMVGFIATLKDVLEKKCKYLYLTTYQNDTYIFYETDVDFELEEKLNELDEIFS